MMSCQRSVRKDPRRTALLSLQRYDGRLFSALARVTLSAPVLSRPPLIHFSSLHTDAVLPEKTWNMFYVPLETFYVILLYFCRFTVP
jgi:hypothetical protein